MTKDQELQFFKVINDRNWSYQNWEVSEAPDFLIKTKGNVIGVELTEVVRKDTGGIIASKYSLEDELAAIVTKQLNESGIDLNLQGNIDFKGELNIRANQKESFCHQITSAIIAHSKSLVKDELSYNHHIDSFIPDEVNWISYDCYPFLDESSFYATRYKAQEFLEVDDILDAVGKKERKTEAYKQKCDQIKLVLVEGLIPSSWIGELKDPSILSSLETAYDEVFLIHYHGFKILKLK
ncbi:MAG: hypothetical protein RIC06_25745 [Cyclobacteriaceae bacterium]